MDMCKVKPLLTEARRAATFVVITEFYEAISLPPL
jgi:hypothetical protein